MPGIAVSYLVRRNDLAVPGLAAHPLHPGELPVNLVLGAVPVSTWPRLALEHHAAFAGNERLVDSVPKTWAGSQRASNKLPWLS